MPAVGRFFVVRGRNTGLKSNVAFQVELVGNEIQIAQNLCLARIAFGPFPFSHQVKGKRVPVDMAFRVAPSSRVAIPEPRPPNTMSRFYSLDFKAKVIPQPKQLVKARKARTNNQRV